MLSAVSLLCLGGLPSNSIQLIRSDKASAGWGGFWHYLDRIGFNMEQADAKIYPIAFASLPCSVISVHAAPLQQPTTGTVPGLLYLAFPHNSVKPELSYLCILWTV